MFVPHPALFPKRFKAIERTKIRQKKARWRQSAGYLGEINISNSYVAVMWKRD